MRRRDYGGIGQADESHCGSGRKVLGQSWILVQTKRSIRRQLCARCRRVRRVLEIRGASHGAADAVKMARAGLQGHAWKQSMAPPEVTHSVALDEGRRVERACQHAADLAMPRHKLEGRGQSCCARIVRRLADRRQCVRLKLAKVCHSRPEVSGSVAACLDRHSLLQTFRGTYRWLRHIWRGPDEWPVHGVPRPHPGDRRPPRDPRSPGEVSCQAWLSGQRGRELRRGRAGCSRRARSIWSCSTS